MMKFLLIVLLALVAANQAELELDGQCDPSVKVVDNFNTEKVSICFILLSFFDKLYTGVLKFGSWEKTEQFYTISLTLYNFF